MSHQPPMPAIPKSGSVRPPLGQPPLGGRWFGRHWFWIVAGVWGLFVMLPILAPVLMQAGWTGAGKTLYFFYSFTCHQLPERSFFLYGNQLTYSLADIQAAWQDTTNPAVLRQFIGSPGMGWKVAWSDRMVAFYGGIWLWSLIWYPLRRRLPRLPWWGLGLLALPMVVDGAAHFASDLAGIDQGFRASNAWLAALTGYRLPPSFYNGDAWGSANSLLRLSTGLLFSLGLVWFGFPYLAEAVEGVHPG